MRRTLWVTLGLLLASSVLLLLNCGGGGGGSDAPPGIAAGLSGCVGEGGGASQTAPGTALLTWDPVTASILEGYRVYYGTAPGRYLQPPGEGVNAGKSTTFTVTKLSSGSRYYFAVTAYDTAGVESGYSNEVCKLIS